MMDLTKLNSDENTENIDEGFTFDIFKKIKQFISSIIEYIRENYIWR